MSDNYIHKIDFEDLETFHTVLHMPRPNNATVDIEHYLIMQAESHPGNGLIKSAVSTLGAWWQKTHHHSAEQTRTSTHRVILKPHSLIRR